MFDGLISGAAVVILTPIIDEIKNWIKDKSVLKGAIGESILIDLEKYTKELEETIIPEYDNIKTLAIQSSPQSKDDAEKIFTAMGELMEIPSQKKANIDCEWEKDFIGQLFKERIGNNPDFLKLKNQAENKIKSFAKLYHLEILHYAKSENVNYERLIKEKEGIILLIDDGMKIFSKLVYNEIGGHLLKVQSELGFSDGSMQIENQLPENIISYYNDLLKSGINTFFLKIINRISDK